MNRDDPDTLALAVQLLKDDLANNAEGFVSRDTAFSATPIMRDMRTLEAYYDRAAAIIAERIKSNAYRT